MSEAKELLVWLDMEMTGLDPERCVPIEVAMLITNAELVELDSMEAVIWQPDSELEKMEPIVRKMHTDNGLIEKVRKADGSLMDAERKMIDLLSRWVRPREGVLCGNSIHQDRKFLARYFPVVNGYLHYRMIDVSTIKEIGRRWYGNDVLYTKGSSDHTALADVRESINELAHYRKSMFKASKDSA